MVLTRITDRPAIVGGKLDTAWIYIVGPGIGSGLAVGITWLLLGAPKEHEKEAASGEGKKPEES